MVSAWGLNISEPPLDRETTAEEGHIAYLTNVYLDFEERVLGKDVEEVRTKRWTSRVR